MAKIHKSAMINMDSAQPVVLDLRCLAAGQMAMAAGDAASTGRKAIESRTEAILAQARAEADCLLETARREAVQIRETAWNEGYAGGSQAAGQELDILTRELHNAYAQTTAALADRYEQSLDDMQGDLLELALQIAEKVISLELSRNDSAFLALAGEAMSRFKQGDKVTVKVSKNDYWRSLVTSAFAAAGRQEEINIITEDALIDGSCIIESSAGIVDASVSVQMGKIREALSADGSEAVL